MIAEEVNEYYPEIVPKNSNNEPESIRYDLLSVILLEEIKKLKAEIDNIKTLI